MEVYLTCAYEFRYMAVAGDFALGDFLDCGVDGVEEGFGFVGTGHLVAYSMLLRSVSWKSHIDVSWLWMLKLNQATLRPSKALTILARPYLT